MRTRALADQGIWKSGKVSGCIYLGDQGHAELPELMTEAFSLNMLANPLHSDVFNNARQQEAEVVSMVANLFHADNGVLTSGGTESILMAMLAYRNRAKDLSSAGLYGGNTFNVVAPRTCHAAFDKAAAYFGISLRKARIGKEGRVDVEHVRSLINSETIAIVGSAPNYPNGSIDDIPALSKLALEMGIGLHVDGCLGTAYSKGYTLH